MAREKFEHSNASTDAIEVQKDTSIDAALILGAERSEMMAMELDRELQSDEPVEAETNGKKPSKKSRKRSKAKRQLTLSEGLLHRFGYLYPDGKSASAKDDEEEQPKVWGYPVALPEEFYHRLPQLLRWLPDEHKEYPHLRDAVLMGLLTVLSAVTPYCAVVEDKKQRSATIYLFVVGNPSAGKSAITAVKDVLLTIDRMLRDEKEEKMKEYARRKKAYEIVIKELEKTGRKLSLDDLAMELATVEEPKAPFTPQIQMPQRTTEARFLQEMAQNQGMPLLMLLSEVKILLNSNAREHGNYFDELLEIYDNTAIDKRLKTNNEEIYVEHPSLAVLLTGVPNQLPKLFKGFDSGMESRFNTMVLHQETRYRREDEVLTEEHQAIIDELQCVTKELYTMLTANGSAEKPYLLVMNNEMMQQMDEYFFTKGNQVEARYKNPNAVSIVRRRRLDFKRLLLLITLYRLYDRYEDWSRVLTTKEIVPTMEDVDLVLYLANYLIDHSLYVLDTYAAEAETEAARKTDISKDEILNSLDNRFFSTEAKEKLKRMGDTNPERTIRRWLNADLIARMGKNGRVYTYRKLTAKETQKRQRASARKILKAQSAVNKRDMSK